MVSQKEIIEALRGECNGCKRDMLADRIEAEGIAPPDWAVKLAEKSHALAIAALGGYGISAQKWQDFIVAEAAAPKGVSDEQ